jgi:D-alanine-D-alanine ligase
VAKVVGFTYDLKSDYIPAVNDPPDANAEYDHEETVEAIKAALESGGHRVVKIGNARRLLAYAGDFLRGRVERSSEDFDLSEIEIVFNIAEGVHGRNRESEVPVILEMLNIPFVGSDAMTMGLTMDKVFTKKVLRCEGIPSPDFVVVSNADDLSDFPLDFPVIVKPRYEGSSKGINENSAVGSIEKLKDQVRWLIETYKQPALIEEFIAGREFTVGMVGNEICEVFPAVQIKIDRKCNLGDLYYTFSHIRSGMLDYVCPAKIPKSLEKMIADVALRTYRAVECRDFGRVDVRVDGSGQPYVLEINTLPSLSKEDVFTVVGEHMGICYEGMINKIFDVALARYGMLNEDAMLYRQGVEI